MGSPTLKSGPRLEADGISGRHGTTVATSISTNQVSKTGGTISSCKKSVLLAAAALLMLVPATLTLGGVSTEENGKIHKNGFDVDIGAFFGATVEEFATPEPTDLDANGDGGTRGSGGNSSQ